MTKELETGGPAFPFRTEIPEDCNLAGVGHVKANSLLVAAGMTARTYAAIHLRVPMSEHDWLNEMIRESQRFELAKAAMQAAIPTIKSKDGADTLESVAWKVADRMHAEQEKK